MLKGEVVPAADGEEPFKVVFSQGDDILAEWPVSSAEAGQERIKRALAAIAATSAAYHHTNSSENPEVNAGHS